MKKYDILVIQRNLNELSFNMDKIAQRGGGHPMILNALQALLASLLIHRPEMISPF